MPLAVRPLLAIPLAILLGSCQSTPPATVSPGAVAPQAATGVAAAAPIDTAAPARDSLMQVVLRSIAGRENEPAERVFKNIKQMKTMPAGRLVRIMNNGFGRALGVNCSFCHVVGEWDNEDNDHKQIAREMMQMVQRINGEILPSIKGLDSQRPTVNCTTCHRGQTKPALQIR